MKAIMLAAGRGSRLFGDDPDPPPKSLLEFGGKTLLERHVDALKAEGVDGLALVVGHRAEDIRTELERIGANGFVETIDNPDFREGTAVSLWCARGVLVSGAPVLVMDADVLYHPDLLRRLTAPPPGDRMLLDRNFDAGDEPVKLSVTQGHVVGFGKGAAAGGDLVGEWPGFLTLAPATARVVADTLDQFVDGGRRDAPMEEVIREVALDRCPGAFTVEDVTGLPWIEIDFPEDLARAEKEVLPLLP